MSNSRRDSTLQEHNSAIRREFDRQAPSWVPSEVSEPLQWVVERLPLKTGLEVLDVAAGTALFGTAIAPHVKNVTAVDISPKMLEFGFRRALELGIVNIEFVAGSAEALPFEDESFDLAVTRYSLHHIIDPTAVLREMARVVRLGGSVVAVDMLASDDPAIAIRQNEFEKAVDATHTRMLPLDELVHAFSGVGLRVESQRCREVAVDFERWQSHLDPDDPQKQLVRRALMNELTGGSVTGFHPFLDGDRLHFYHTWGVVRARKESTP